MGEKLKNQRTHVRQKANRKTDLQKRQKEANEKTEVLKIITSAGHCTHLLQQQMHFDNWKRVRAHWLFLYNVYAKFCPVHHASQIKKIVISNP